LQNPERLREELDPVTSFDFTIGPVAEGDAARGTSRKLAGRPVSRIARQKSQRGAARPQVVIDEVQKVPALLDEVAALKERAEQLAGESAKPLFLIEAFGGLQKQVKGAPVLPDEEAYIDAEP